LRRASLMVSRRVDADPALASYTIGRGSDSSTEAKIPRARIILPRRLESEGMSLVPLRPEPAHFQTKKFYCGKPTPIRCHPPGRDGKAGELPARVDFPQ
jgi:hypothetical protein